jgi:phytoene dehydrogenase-like protein
MREQVIIVGAGIAGLACALRLKERGIQARIFEAADRVGGRIATDEQEGFLLDRGFQVLLTAYPEASRLLDFNALQLARFHAGAKVFWRGKLRTVADPTRQPGEALPALFSGIGTLFDKLHIMALRAYVSGPSLERVLNRPEVTTWERLRKDRFSARIVQQFFRPFLGGIFLEDELFTSSRKFEFVFRMFSQGFAALPNAGMRAIPEQLASRLQPGQVEFNRAVRAIETGAVRLETGERMETNAVVLATDPWAAQRLLGMAEGAARPVACVYFVADTSPVPGPWLVLNGESSGPVNNLCVPSEVQANYAPPGKSLISVGVIDPQAAMSSSIEADVRAQLTSWFGDKVRRWRHLRTYRIARPIPLQPPPALANLNRSTKLRDGVYRCGDADWIASIEGALRSGLRVGDELQI